MLLLSKLKRLNPTLITHPFSKSILGFCNSSIITQQQQKQDDEETIKQFTSMCNDGNFYAKYRTFAKPLNPNLVETILLRHQTCQPRFLFHLLDCSAAFRSQNVVSYLLVANRCNESYNLTSDPNDLKLAEHTIRYMLYKNKPHDILDGMKSFGLTSSLFSRLINTFYMGMCYVPVNAVYFLVNYKNGDCFPDLDCLNSLMKKLLETDQMDLFWMVYERMIEANVDFNCILYNNVINGYSKIGKTEDAKRVLSEMNEKDCSPNSVTYNLIIGGLLEQGEVDEAFNLKNEMVATGIKVDVETFICIIKGLCRLGEYKEAIELLGSMEDEGVLPDANCYYPIIRDLCNAKRIEEVWDLIAQMVENGVKLNRRTFGALRSAFATKKNVMIFFKKSIDHGIIPDKDILATLFEGAYGNGWGVLSIMINVIDGSNLRDSLHIYNELLQRLLQCNKMNLAIELFSEIPKKGLIPDCNTYGYLIFGFIDTLHLNEWKAHLLFKEMQQRNVCPNDVTVSKILQTHLPSQRKILLQRWLELMKKEGVTHV